VVLSCLGDGFDAQSLRAVGGPGIRIGEIRVTKATASTGLLACRHSSVEDRIRPLEDERASVVAEQESNQLLIEYLKSIKGSAEDRAGGVSDLRNLAASTEILRRSAQAVLVKRQSFARKLEELDRQLAALADERDRLGTKNREYQNVVVSVTAERSGDLVFSYLVNQAGWTPSYRAELDTATGALTTEREAQIAQATGENWTGVHMRLSTAQPRAGVSPPVLLTWTVGIRADKATVEQSIAIAGEMSRASLAPAPAAADSNLAGMPAPPLFEAAAFQGVYATEFIVAAPITLPIGDRSALQ
jgi:uncharacterized protein (TIGR02231 family)